jgi:microcystin-dependent protein
VYAGTRSDDTLKEAGWLLCQGQKLSITEYPDLFDAIGTSNGGDGNRSFNLPDYRGRFLRGTCNGQGSDPDAADRTAAASGGATGDQVGSVQDWATGNPGVKESPLPLPKTPRTPFTAKVPHLPSSHREFNANELTGHQMAWFSGTIAFPSDGGGDKETRPANAGGQYIIKADPNADLPVGAVIPFAGAKGAELKDWYVCTGAAKGQARDSALYSAIGSAHGSSGDNFNLPDYRGRFVRGVDAGAGRDPDAADRKSPAPGGGVGDSVGSVQDWATGKPRNPFTVSLHNMPRTLCKLVECASPWDNSYWNELSVSVELTSKGGDKESRPENSSVDWLIRRVPVKSGDTAAFPVGGIIAVPGNADLDDSWRPCHGQSYYPKDQPALFAAIGTLHGGDAITTFFVPDYRGRFLRGADRGAKRDPDAANREQPQRGSGSSGDLIGSIQRWATGKPAKPITANVAHLPNTSTSDTGYPGTGHDTCRWEPSDDWPVELDTTGGDHETRPSNAGVIFWIKIK